MSMMLFMLLFWLVAIVLCISVMRSFFAPQYRQQPVKRKRSAIHNNIYSETSRENEHALFNNTHNQQENHNVY